MHTFSLEIVVSRYLDRTTYSHIYVYISETKLNCSEILKKIVLIFCYLTLRFEIALK